MVSGSACQINVHRRLGLPWAFAAAAVAICAIAARLNILEYA